MNILTLIKLLIANRKTLFKAILGLAVAFLLGWGITLHKQNKKLSESLEMAQNNIEAYQGSLAGSQQANNVLQLDIKDLHQQNDELLQKLDSVAKNNKIKSKEINTAATQKQTLDVNEGKEVGGQLKEILKDTTYTDSIQYNDLTKVYYTIGNDTVWVGIKLENTQYLYIYTTKEYKNKKSFLKRLFTLDFKKVKKEKYSIINTNDLLKTSEVRVVEDTTK